jgi:predicted nucleic acid-binding Zn ribbon protein
MKKDQHKGNINIARLLKQRMSHYGLAKQYDASFVCKQADAVSGGQFKAVSFRQGVLKIRVKSASRAHLVRMNQHKIISQINKGLGEERVTRMKFEVGEEPSDG